MKIKNRVNGKIIDVPSDHANNVLIRQGAYMPIDEAASIPDKAEEQQEEAAPPIIRKKPGRPRKKKAS